MAPPPFASQLSTAEYNDIIEQIRLFPEQLRTVVSAITPAHLQQSYREGGWTATQLVHHLADAHMNMSIRLKVALTAEHPTVQLLNLEAWAVLPDTTDALVEDSLMLIQGLHRRAAHLLVSLDQVQRARGFRHPVYQRDYTLDQAAAMLAWHGGHHLAQLRQIIPAEPEVPRG